MITAHSGCEGTAENTIASIGVALESGVDAIELDVRTSADGLPVLAHDPYLLDSNGDRVIIADHDRKTIVSRTEDAYNTPALLEDVLALVQRSRVILNLDLKDTGSVSVLYGSIIDHGLDDRTVFSGCHEEWARHVRQLVPDARVLLNAPHLEKFSSAADPSDQTDYARAAQELCAVAVEIGCCGINVNHEHCRPYLVTRATQQFLPVSVWTVDREGDMRRVLDMGVYAVTTRFPRRLWNMLQTIPAPLSTDRARAIDS